MFPDSVGRAVAGVVNSITTTCVAGSWNGMAGRSFISRAAIALLQLSDTKSTVGGLQGEWWNATTGEPMLDGTCFESLHRALGASGVSAVSQFLGLCTIQRLRGVILSISELSPDMEVFLKETLGRIHNSSSDAVQALKQATQRAAPVVTPLLDGLSTIGQYELLRLRLHRTLRLRARLDAPLILESFEALDGAELIEAVIADERFDDDLEQREQLTELRLRLAHGAQLPGLGNPIRQVYATITDLGISPTIDVLFAVAVMSMPTDAPQEKPSRKSKHSKHVETLIEPTKADVYAPLLAGLASLLQQLPRARTEGLLEIIGIYLGGLCLEGTEDKVMGPPLTMFLGDLLDLLGLPREQFSKYLPQALLDLVPFE